MRKILLKFTIILVLSIASGTSAHNNALPDSSQNKKNVRLQLPDEIIYGKNRAKRIIMKSKADFDAKLRLIEPQINLKPQFFSSYSDKIYYSPFGKQKQRGLNFSLRGGSFGHLKVAADLIQQWKKINFQLLSSFKDFRGQHRNSQQREIFARAFLSGQISQNLTTSLNINTKFQKYGLFEAYHLSSSSRKMDRIESDFNLRYSHASNYLVGARIFFNGIRFDDDYNETETVRDNWFGFNVQYQKRLSSTKIFAEARYRHNDFAQDLSQMEFAAKAGFALALAKNLHVAGGIGYQDVSVSNEKDQVKLFPEIELNFAPSIHFSGKLLLHSELLPIVFNHFAFENPFLALNDSLIPINRKFRSSLSVNFRPENVMSFGMAFSFEKRENDVYWTKNSATNLFALGRFASTTRIDLSIKSKIQVSEKFGIDGKLQMKFYSIDDDSLKGKNSHFPYVERFSFPLILHWNATRNLATQLEFNYLSNRYTQATGEDQLPDYLFVSATITKDFRKNYSAYLKATNLFDQRIEIWHGFPETGISFVIGIVGKW